jgi:pyrimidine-nucleoside phosphorylase
MHLVELIRRKRDGLELSREEIEYIVAGYTRDELPDYQVSAFLMATVLRGMTRAETAALTEAMLHSGNVLDFSGLPAAKVDKHSTGGVGDKTSLILVAVLAAGGLYVPMVSGRGLGHTGGTLDKLEAIPGFNVNLSLADFRRVLKDCGCAMIGQTAEIAPADKKLYALRDVTGTVESPFLICASIMCKKLAEGLDGLVLDVKTGSGAFMKDRESAEFLAELMVETGERMGKKIVALITDMDQPLGRYIGNALEVEECVRILRGEIAGSEDLYELTIELCAWAFLLGDRVNTIEQGRDLSREQIANGKALAKFKQMVEMQGGDSCAIDDAARLPRAAHRAELRAPEQGFITAMQCDRIGVANVVLGGGRFTKNDVVDPSVGIVLHKKTGDAVAAGEALCTVHYNSAERFAEAHLILESAYIYGEMKPEPRPLVHRVISSQGSAAVSE